MMQNGFRRLALAQGLLPEATALRAADDRDAGPAMPADADTARSDAPIAAWREASDMRAARAT
jgi:hypothetical protein